jgi:hypothetical protein
VVRLSPAGRLGGISKFVLQKFPVSTNKWCIQVLSSPNFFSGMEAGRNVKDVGDDVAVL